MKLKRVLAVGVVLAVMSSALVGCSTGNNNSSSAAATSSGSASSSEVSITPGQTPPRNESFYMAGLQWGAPTSFSPLSTNPAFPVQGPNAMQRELMFETLYMYNQLDGKMYPLLADGDVSWDSAGTTATVKIKKAAKWNDGSKLTADDVVYTWDVAKRITSLSWSSYWDYLDSVTKVDDYTVTFKCKADNVNPLMVKEALDSVYVVPKAYFSAIETKDKNDATKIQQEFCAYPVASGPYKLFYYDDTKIMLIRDDNYWGKDSSMWGKLPAPKYIIHNIFKDNASGDNALKAGEIDMSQQFTPKIWTFQNVKTFLSKSPYFVPGTIPMIIFNTTKNGLDNAHIRKAIAASVDTDKVIATAMSGYSAKFVPSMMLPTDTDQSLIDASALKDLQWTSADKTVAQKELDASGAKKGGDGFYTMNGKKLSYKAECPTGWSDWNASLEIVSASAAAIGIDVKTYFPEAPVWTNDLQTGNFDIIMNSYQGAGISSPWQRARQIMQSNVPAVGKTAYYNYGRYKNDAADKLIAAIPTDTGDKLKTDWTDLNKIYLTDVPATGLMYRPVLFYVFGTKYWKNYPVDGDGTNIPPQICTDGYGVAALYKLTPAK